MIYNFNYYNHNFLPPPPLTRIALLVSSKTFKQKMPWKVAMAYTELNHFAATS